MAHQAVHERGGLQADGQAELAEGQAVRWRGVQRIEPQPMGQAVFRRIQHIRQQGHIGIRGHILIADQQLRHPAGIEQQPANAERIGAEPVPSPTHGRETVGGLAQFRRRAQPQAGHGADQGQQGDIAVQRIVLAHGRDLRAGQVDAHFPVHALFLPSWRGMGKGFYRHHGQFGGVLQQQGFAQYGPRPGQGMDPLGQIMEILPVPVPFALRVEGFLRPPFIQFLADAQPAGQGVAAAFLFTQTADPALPGAFRTVTGQHMVNLIDQLQRQRPVTAIAGGGEQAEEIAQGEGIGPQIASGRAGRCAQPGACGKIGHKPCRRRDVRVRPHVTPRTGRFRACP